MNTETDMFFLDARSVFNSWRGDNSEQLNEYFVKHNWLEADICKLKRFILRERLVKAAVTRRDIYGVNEHGMLVMTSRRILGIGDNC